MSTTENIEYVDPRTLEESPFHRRTRWGDMRSLTRSLAETGMIEPIIARLVDLGGRKPVREVVVGHRRRRGAIDGEIEVVPVVFRELTDDEVIEIQATENMRREDLHPLDECDYFVMLIERGNDVRTLSKRFTRSPGYIKDRLILGQLSSKARQAYAKDKLSDLAARRIAKLPTPAQQGALVDALVAGAIADDEIVVWIRSNALVPLSDTEWSLDDRAMPGGACSECPKRTGAQRELFEEIVGAEDMCADPKCWRTKMDHAANLAIERAQAGGLKVVTGDPSKVFLPIAGGRPIVIRSSGFLDANADCPTVPGKSWLDAAKAAGGEPVVTLRQDQDGRPRYLIEEKAVAGLVRRAVRDESTPAAAAELEADPARRIAREAKLARTKAEEALVVRLVSGEGDPAVVRPLILRLVAVRVVSLSSVRRVAKATGAEPEMLLLGRAAADEVDPWRLIAALLAAEVGVDEEPVIEIVDLARALGVALP